jgi:hypothetical protein
MPGVKPRYSKEEFARRGEAIFQKEIQPQLKDENGDDFVVIDIETGAYEIDSNELAASARLRVRVPKAQIWIRRVRSPYARTFGGHRRPAE